MRQHLKVAPMTTAEVAVARATNREDPAYDRKKDAVLLAACRQRQLDLATQNRLLEQALAARITELQARRYDE